MLGDFHQCTSRLGLLTHLIARLCRQFGIFNPWHGSSKWNRASNSKSKLIMLTKTSRWLCGIAAVLLGAFCFVANVHAANPPWPPLVSIIALDPDGSEEGSDAATFLVVRIGLPDGPLSVQYTLGGAAVNGVDYQSLPGTVSIGPWEYFAPITVTPVDDYEIEGAESVVAALQQPPVWPPPYIVTWPSVAFGEIADNDLAPTNTPPNVAIVRPPDGAIFEEGDDIPLLARAWDRDGRVITVEFFDGTNSLGIVTNRPLLASADLLNASEDPLFDLDAELFPDLDATAGISPVPIPGNLFRLIWSNAPPGRHVLTAVATDNDGDSTRSAPVEIKVLEAPPLPVVVIKATDPVASEPGSTADHLDTATFTIFRRGPTNDTLRVFYRIGGTASNSVDYAELAHSVEISAGERRAHMTVEPLDDMLVEEPESVVLSLVAPPCDDEVPPPPGCYEVGRAHVARAVIRDNDTPPNRPPLVRLVKPEDGDVFLAPADIRLAALARDFDGYVTTIEFFEGTNSLGIVTNNPTTDSVFRPPFSLVWSNVPPGRYVLGAVATDNDGASTESRPVEIKVGPRLEPPVVNVTAIDPVAIEPAGPLTPIDPARFSVTRTGGTNSPLTVFYRIGGTASNGVDYQLLSGRVTIPAGASSNSIFIIPLEDNLVEGLESVVLKLEPAPLLSPANTASWWYRIGSNNVARAVVRDNDVAPTNVPPRVVIVHPENGDVFHAPVDIKLAALAHDSDGWVRTVEFFDGNLSLGIVTNTPAPDADNLSPEQLFRLLWKNVPPGPHVLTALATDNRGAKTRSGPIEIKVRPLPCPPIVTIHAADPYAGEGNPFYSLSPKATAPLPITPRPDTATFVVVREGCVDEPLTVYYRLEGTARNGVDYRELSGEVVIPGGAHRAPIIVDPIDDILPEPTETVVAVVVPPVCIAIYPPPPGCYRVGDPNRAAACIFDNDRNQSPRLEIVHPSDGDIFRAYSDIEIDVATRDSDGWVTTMEFFANGQKIGEQAVQFIVPPPPGEVQKFSMTWSNVPPDDYVLHARATDNVGAMSLSDPVRIKVAPIPPAPVVTIEAIDPVASEPNPLALNPALDVAIFKVSRGSNTGGPLTVRYRAGGTASNGVDYVELSGAATIPSNAPSALIYVSPKSDDLVEGTESVILTLLQPPCVLSNTITSGCYLVGNPGRDVAYIRDFHLPNRPPTVAIVSPANGSVFSAPLDLRLVAAAGDPDGWVTTVEFFDGTNSLGIVLNPRVILDDAPARLSELNTDVLTANTLIRPFILIWSNVPPGKHILSAVATDNAGDSTRSRPIEIFVRQPGELPIVRIMATDPFAREGTSNTAAFRIRRTGPTNSALLVFYTIRGTASNGVDYVTIPHSLSIPPGRRSARILITPINDDLPERIETVLLRLVDPPFDSLATYEIGRPARAGAVILDNDYRLMTQLLPGPAFLAHLPVMAGAPYRLESSGDLDGWLEESSGVATEDGAAFVDDDLSGNSRRFFRVVPEFGELEDEE